ncbi:tetratricopeptide repeat protein [Lentzea sp. NPDC059081]|uniref:tetratricopeptide repeat protein n=1 Tax=Lentzea sp. NPDC059081 TaxID=3346719 RepID=UPI0036913600
MGAEDVHNEVEGDVSGVVVQAGVISGGFHVHAERPVTPPHQLPLEIRHFAGRQQELDQLTSLRDQAAGTAVAVITGTGGIGKTTLAVRWAHSVADEYPDGELYVNLRGFDPADDPVEPGTVLHGFLDALGVGPARIPDDPAGMQALYRSLVAHRRMLIVLDNARDADQVRPLLPGAAGCLVLVTSRNRLASLVAQEGARPVALEAFTGQEAAELLATHLGEARAEAEPEATAALADFCAGLPLALSIVAAQAAVHPGFSLAQVLEGLRAEPHTLDALDLGDASGSVRTVFSWSVRALDDDATRLFRLLGLHVGPDFGLGTAASLAAEPPARTRHLLAGLTAANLVEQYVPGRFRMHDLVRACAAELVQEPETAPASRRMLDFLLHTTESAAIALNRNRDRQHLGVIADGTAYVPITNTDEAFRWYHAELATLSAAARQSTTSYAWQIPWAMTSFLYRQGRWTEWAELHEAALDRADDDHARARTLRLLGNAYTLLDRRDEGRAQHERAQALFESLDDAHGLARTHHARAWAHGRFGENREAIAHAEEALRLYRGYGNSSGEAHALDAAGWFHAQLREFEKALDYCTRALEMHTELGDASGMADDYDSLGYIHHHLGDTERSFAEYDKAIALWQELGAAYDEAVTLVRVGEAHEDGGDRPAALATWQRALEIFVQLDHPEADTVRAKLTAI